MSREERFGIGSKIDGLLLELLETLRKADYANVNSRVSILGESIGKTDSVRFFLQIAWETKLIPNKQFETLAPLVEEAGRMIGGWRKGLVAKTPPKGGGERKE